MRHSNVRIFVAGAALATALAVPAAAQNIPNLPDLVGARAAGAMNELDRRGFEQVDNFTSGNTRYSIRWREESRQCLQVTIADGRIYDVSDIGRHPRCVSQHDSSSASFDDLVGARAAGAMSELERRGFDQVDNFTSGNTRYSIQWNSRTRQCLQATIADGRIYDIRDIGTHPRCGSQSSSSSQVGAATSTNSARINWYPRLVGGAADGARTQVRQAGFSRVTRQGGGEGSIWYNSASRQCLQITVSGGRVTEADDISGDRRCR